MIDVGQPKFLQRNQVTAPLYVEANYVMISDICETISRFGR